MSTTEELSPFSGPSEPTTVEKLQGLRWSIASNMANTVFVQFTFFGSVYVLFLNKLGFNKTDIGFLLSFMPFAGLIALFIAPAVARFGYKRTFVTFYALRKVVTALLLLIPWMLDKFGSQATFLFIGAITASFAFTRAIAETSRFPWIQEFVPRSMQGKYTATNNVFATIAGFIAVTVAGYVIEQTTGLTGFMWLIGVGLLFGFASVWLMSNVPGGAPLAADEAGQKQGRDLTTALGDRNFLRYLAGAGLIVVTTAPVSAFIPLYMQEEIGLTTGLVVYLQSSTLLAAMFTSYLWGWAADRYGSKPILVSGVVLKIFLPICWIVMPRVDPLNFYAALGIAFLQGVAEMGWAIGSARLLFVSVVPTEKKSDYMALYFAFIGITGGLGQLFSGRILDVAQGITGSVAGITLNPYTPLFLIALVFPFLSIFLFRRIQTDDVLGLGQFVRIFFRGNPFLAMSSLIRYQFAQSEQTTIEVTERMGRAKSDLAIDELLEALADPRFNVRFEAIVAAARMKPNPRLLKSLVAILEDSSPALSVIAAWALGRIGSKRAIVPLRKALDAPFRSIQAQSARSLGTLADQDSADTFLARLGNVEEEAGLRMAYASSLGKLQVVDAVDSMLQFFATVNDKIIQAELALALARVVGREQYFIRLERRIRQDSGTALSQAVSTLSRLGSRRKGRRRSEINVDLQQTPARIVEFVETLDACADAFAHNQLQDGLTLLVPFVRAVAEQSQEPSRAKILTACADQIERHATERLESTILALHTIHLELAG
ncbi:MFS transporter [Chloroflexi bacterium TSY]|nr:MFS transporter [Chloroflexi bacterium TSY]